MIFEFEITSEENADFSRLIKIKEDQTFLDLHKAIQRAVGYDDSQMASFYTIDKHGERDREITLFEMSEDEEELETFVMDVTKIREIIKGKIDSLLYVYDFFSDRYFNVSLVEKSDEEGIKYPVCTLCLGDAPEQSSDDEDSFMSSKSKYDDEDDDMFMNEELAYKKSSKKKDYYDDPYLMDDLDDGFEYENIDDYEDLL